MTSPSADLAVIGGGIVGLATAMAALEQRPSLRLILLEKEPRLAAHQTSHNSGVIHSGLYYRPGSLKAATCVLGAQLMKSFCASRGIPFEVCGKLVVATESEELARLDALHQRGLANGVTGMSMLGPEALREIEPHARGLRALHVPSAGIVNYVNVAEAFAAIIRARGGMIRLAARVERISRRDGLWMLETTDGEVRARGLVTCAGLYADRVAALAGAPDDGVIIVPFRGDYYELVPDRRALVRAMIYPVPDPALPFLGVHFTRGIDGSVHAGPNAVLALRREGYGRADLDLAEAAIALRHRGFWRMAQRHWRTGGAEMWRAFSRRAFVRALQRLVPALCDEDVVPASSGVRAQALDRTGALLDDFSIAQGPHAIYVRNVPSPAATASIRIGQLIAEMAASAFGF